MNVSLTKAQFFLLLFIFQTGVVYIAFQTPLIINSRNSSWLIFIVASVIHYGLLLFFERYHSYFYLNVFFSLGLSNLLAVNDCCIYCLYELCFGVVGTATNT